jgi:intracellular sulfur oxidation DsrE/DsrF family protein
MKRLVRTVSLAVCLSVTAVYGIAHAQVAPIDRPFVEHHVVLQLSDNADAKQHMILNNVENLLKALGPDKVSVEVVAFGPGLELLNEANPLAEHIRSLTQQGVRFDACQNTIDTWERNNSKPFPLLPAAQRVPSGVTQILYLVEHGYTNIRP